MKTVFSHREGHEHADVSAAGARPPAGAMPAGAGTDCRELMDVKIVLRRSLDIALRGSDIESRIDLPEDLLPVVGDDVRFQGVFIQIFLSTRRPGVRGGLLRITGGNCFGDGEHPCLVRQSCVHICISDTRSGARESFAACSATRPPAGGVSSGLRLAVARSIVKDAGGWIRTSYAADSGAGINVYLPAEHGSVHPRGSRNNSRILGGVR